MKIDLHCHTKQIKKGDGKGRNVTPEIFREKIANANIKIVAITNHNAFLYEQYLELKKAVQDICLVWPGVEIDILGSNDKRFHLIVVANPENAELFNNKIAIMYNQKNLETCTFSLQDVYKNLNECDVIYIPHYHKTPSISEEDKEELQRIVGDRSRVFVELQDHRSMGVFANYDYNVLIGSDVKDWTKYEECHFSELRLPVENFSQFCLLAKRDKVIVDTLLNKKKTYNLIAKPYKTVKFPLTIYSDVNIIFGQKGTGKSEILKSLYESMQEQGITSVKYTGSDRDDDFKNLIKTNDMSQDLSKLGISDCAEVFTYLREWNDFSPTLFSKYLDWYRTKDNNTNKSRMKITESTYCSPFDSSSIKIHNDDYRNVKESLKTISKIKIDDYLSKEKSETFKALFYELRDIIRCSLKEDLIEEKSIHMVNYSIEKIKTIADKNSDSVSKPSSTGFLNFALNRIKLKENSSIILKSLDAEQVNEREFLGELDEKGKLYINKKYRMLCSESKTAEFINGITYLRSLVDAIKQIYEEVFSDSVSKTLSTFNESLEENKIKTITPFLGLSKQIVLESGEVYKPSNGEKGILLLQKILKKEADAYFLDEPELGMGNSYIDTNIRPIISDLAKKRKVIVVATHNANIAVRTLPYLSIFRIHENGNYKTYIGNPFNDQLVNIDDDKDIKSWTDESLHTLEGGPEAFYERRDIYESKND